jgi:hypothetical protein
MRMLARTCVRARVRAGMPADSRVHACLCMFVCAAGLLEQGVTCAEARCPDHCPCCLFCFPLSRFAVPCARSLPHPYPFILHSPSAARRGAARRGAGLILHAKVGDHRMGCGCKKRLRPTKAQAALSWLAVARRPMLSRLWVDGVVACHIFVVCRSGLDSAYWIWMVAMTFVFTVPITLPTNPILSADSHFRVDFLAADSHLSRLR